MSYRFTTRKDPQNVHGINVDKLAVEAKITDPTKKELLRTITLHSFQSYKAAMLLKIYPSTTTVQQGLIQCCVADIRVQKSLADISHDLMKVARKNPKSKDINDAIVEKANAGDPVAAFVLAHRLVNQGSPLSGEDLIDLVKYQKIYESDKELARCEFIKPAMWNSCDESLQALLSKGDDGDRSYQATFRAVRVATQEILVRGMQDYERLRDALADHAKQLMHLVRKPVQVYSQLSYIAKILGRSSDYTDLITKIDATLQPKKGAVYSRLQDELLDHVSHKDDESESVIVSQPIKLDDNVELQIVFDPTKKANILVLSAGSQMRELRGSFVESMEDRLRDHWDTSTGPSLEAYQKALSIIATMEPEGSINIASANNQGKARELIGLIGYYRCPHDLVSSRVFGDKGDTITGLMQEYLNEHLGDKVESDALKLRIDHMNKRLKS